MLITVIRSLNQSNSSSTQVNHSKLRLNHSDQCCELNQVIHLKDTAKNNNSFTMNDSALINVHFHLTKWLCPLE